MTGVKRAMSILLSAVMLMGNLITPMTAFAEEAVTEGNEIYEAPVHESKPKQPDTETEAPDYLVTIPHYEEGSFLVDEGPVQDHVREGESKVHHHLK